MLPTDDLLQRLAEIDLAYQNEKDPIKALLWAKLSALEVGGWTEECIDSMVKDYIIEKNPPSKDKILEQLKYIYGFQYAKEFRKIWIEIIGTILFDKIETCISLKCLRLESALNELKRSRDIAAHTYTKQDTNIDAPSKMIDLLKRIESGLSDFMKEVYQLNI
jgi:hypothetical protein